jgi:hypothetical protein
MEYRRQVALRRDGDDFVVARKPDDVVVFRSRMPMLCGKCAFRFDGRLSATIVSADDLARSLAPARTDQD